MRSAVLLLCLACAGCAGTVFGIELGSEKIQDCVPGSLSRPCN